MRAQVYFPKRWVTFSGREGLRQNRSTVGSKSHPGPALALRSKVDRRILMVGRGVIWNKGTASNFSLKPYNETVKISSKC